MGHPVLPQHREVHRGEELLVAHLDRVRALARQGGEETVEPVGELATAPIPLPRPMAWNSKTNGPVWSAK